MCAPPCSPAMPTRDTSPANGRRSRHGHWAFRSSACSTIMRTSPPVIAEAAVHGETDPAARVIGIAFDGTGAGATPNPGGPLRNPVLDSTIWGGEILLASLSSYERVAHLEPWRLPGGSTSVRDPRRNAFSLLEQHGLLDHPGASTLLATLSSDERALTSRMLERGINCPSTSSMGSPARCHKRHPWHMPRGDIRRQSRQSNIRGRRVEARSGGAVP